MKKRKYCKCGIVIEFEAYSDKWYVLEYVGKNGYGYWECGFIKDG